MPVEPRAGDPWAWAWANAAAESPDPNPGDVVAFTQSQLVIAVADRAELSKSDAKRALAALEDVVLVEMGNAHGVDRWACAVDGARQAGGQGRAKAGIPRRARRSRSPARPASVDLRARPLAKAKGALASVRKARRGLAA